MALEYVPFQGTIVTRQQAKSAGLQRYFMGPDKPCKRGHISERKTCDGQCIECTRVHSMDQGRLDAKRRRTKASDDRHRDEKNAKARAQLALAMVNDPEKVRARGRYYYHLDPKAAMARTQRWQKANQEHLLAYRQVNKEKTAQYNKEYQRANPEKGAASTRRWQERNPEKYLQWRKDNPEAVRAIKQARRARQRGAEGSHTKDELRALFTKQNGKCVYCTKPLTKSYCADHIVPLAKGGTNWISNIQLLCRSCNAKKHAIDPLDYARRIGRLL